MSKPKGAQMKVYPVAGRFLMGVPHVEQEVPPDEAETLVETGAFSLKPEEPAPAAEEQE